MELRLAACSDMHVGRLQALRQKATEEGCEVIIISAQVGLRAAHSAAGHLGLYPPASERTLASRRWRQS